MVMKVDDRSHSVALLQTAYDVLTALDFLAPDARASARKSASALDLVTLLRRRCCSLVRTAMRPDKVHGKS
jgi:hypothetical protein